MTTSPEQEREAIARIISGGAPFPSKRSFTKADLILSRSPQGEIERLRTALEEILEETHNSGYPNEIVAMRMIERIEEMAMAALLPTSQEPSHDE